MKKKVSIVIVLLLLITIITGIIAVIINNDGNELKTIKSEDELLSIYDGKDDFEVNEGIISAFSMPFSFLINSMRYSRNYNYKIYDDFDIKNGIDVVYETTTQSFNDSRDVSASSTLKDYSTTNIQVENVDEADITKTDGDYIYSISDNKVIITDVRDENNIKIASKIEETENNVPEELILYKNKLVVISSRMVSSSIYYRLSNNNTTIVEIYDISNKENPFLIKDYELLEPYYTSRCIDNRLFVISTGLLKKEDGKIVRIYNENSVSKEIKLDNIKYLKDVKTKKQTLISSVDLNELNIDVKVDSYLMDISNAYVSENSIYLLNQKYEYNYNDVPPVYSIFGLQGIIGAFTYNLKDRDIKENGYYTEIYKFDISKNGDVGYKTKSKVEGQTINQYSLDEKDGHLRVALYDSKGTRVVIFNEELKEIGRTNDLAKGEKMYSSRFIGNKAYLVTYKTIDPLFVIDLSNEENPKVLGKLKIPGYSTYLHPYDENHIIGIGMETEEIVNRNISGKVISTTARLTGMKMALFDVSDVNNPKQISNTIIGDNRTTSAILTNPKALLFSKQKELIAIPVNNYEEDFEINTNSDEYESLINSYKSYNKKYVAEGYFVYKINLEDGFKLKGVITHEKQVKSNYYYYYNSSKLLRGLYIDNNLYTVSEDMVKVNNLDTLEQVTELKIR